MEEIILKWKKTPGPMTYKTEAKKRTLNKTLSLEPKNGYAGDIEARAKEIPSVGKYNLLKSYSAIEKHSFGARIGPKQRPETTGSNDRMGKIKKLKAPGPADYDTETSFRKT